MAFNIDVQGFKIKVDAKEEVGGENSGPTPKPLMLAALAGCTGMDVVSILGKMRVDFDALDIEVEGDVSDEHPKMYKHMHIIYKLKGNNIDKEKVIKAVEMSQDKYCGVSALYKQVIAITYEIQVN